MVGLLFFIVVHFSFPIFGSAFSPNYIFSSFASISAITDGLVSFDPYFLAGIILDMLGCSACWLFAVGVTDKDDQLVGVLLLEFKISLVVELCVLAPSGWQHLGR